MASMDTTAGDFLGQELSGKLTAKAKALSLAQLKQLGDAIRGGRAPSSDLASLSLNDLHSIRDAFAPYSSQDATRVTSAAAGCCCCCCQCCCCGCACSSCSTV